MEERFIKFVRKEKTQEFVAFICYVLVISICCNLPLIVKVISYTVFLLMVAIWSSNYVDKIIEKIPNLRKETIIGKLKEEAKTIVKELFMFLPIFYISIRITALYLVGETVNQAAVNEKITQYPISALICVIIIGPIFEEFIFRKLPYKFIKNKILYIIISTVIFAGMHVIDDPNASYYIWFYMIRSWYYAYRYHKTQDICVPISMHILNNFVAALPIILSYF